MLGSSSQLTAAMRAAAGPLFGCTEALKDLGVIPRAGPAEKAAAMARWSTACNRLAKIAKLSMPMHAKGKFAAAAALSAGVFGTSCREQPTRPAAPGAATARRPRAGSGRPRPGLGEMFAARPRWQRPRL